MMVRYVVAFVVALGLVATQANAAEFATTLERIEKTGTVRIGFRESEPPMSFRDQNGEPVGYSIDLCMRIVNGTKTALDNPDIKTEFVPVTATNRFQALADDEIDILCGATTKTHERAELVDFTQLTFATGGSLLSLKEKEVASIGDLQGKKVAVVQDTTTIEALKPALASAVSDAEVVPVDSATAGMEALLSGEVDAFSSDQVVLIGLALTNESPDRFALSEELFSFEPFALAIRRGDSDFRLLADRVLAQLYRSEQIIPIYSRWFGEFAEKMPTLLEAMYVLGSTPE